MTVPELATLWRAALKDLQVRYPDPDVDILITVEERTKDVKVLFNMINLPDSRALEANGYFPSFEYYFYADHWPGVEKARLWVMSVWALFMEHEAMEMTYLNGKQLADPHTDDWCAGHRWTLDRRHNMEYMIGRLWKTGGWQ